MAVTQVINGKDKAVYRCQLEDFPNPLEIPQWMFDRVYCVSMLMRNTPSVDVHALIELKWLLHSALDGEDQHHSQKGDADEVATQPSSNIPVGSVSSGSKATAVAIAAASVTAERYSLDCDDVAPTDGQRGAGGDG